MHDEPRQKLRELIIKYGRSLCDDPRRCEALLKDHCGHYKREIFVLISALKNRVADDLLKASSGIPQSILLARLNKQLEEELAMTAEAAHWAVESWALALGVIAQPLPVAKPAPMPLPTSSPIPPHPVAEALMAGRYRDNGDGTVTDVQTGLQWMRCSLGQEWKGGTCTGEAKKYTWQKALDIAAALNRQGGYAGYRDWRVPTIEELKTLIDPSGSPKINQLAFPNTLPLWYWSSSAYANYPTDAWGIHFSSGNDYVGSKSYDHYTRLVRGGQ
ncbi:MAG: DUF1566 domain-containing protein [Candidatus Competibacteraceae bacterium]